MRPQSDTQSAQRDPGPRSDNHPEIGQRLRVLRRRANLTLREVAGRTGFSVSYLSQVERGYAAPSLAALKKIANALGSTVGYLFDGEVVTRPLPRNLVVRAGERKRLVYPSSQIVNELLCPDLQRQIEMLLVTAPPGTESGQESMTHHGEEALFVLEGSIDVWVAGEHYHLEAGDSMAFPSTLEHRWENPGPDELKAVWVMVPPSF